MHSRENLLEVQKQWEKGSAESFAMGIRLLESIDIEKLDIKIIVSQDVEQKKKLLRCPQQSTYQLMHNRKQQQKRLKQQQATIIQKNKRLPKSQQRMQIARRK
jgi:hypothetical protein